MPARRGATYVPKNNPSSAAMVKPGSVYRRTYKAKPRKRRTYKKRKSYVRRKPISISMEKYDEKKCLRDYKMSLLNPWNMNLAPCLPTFPSVPSERLTTFNRFTMTVGSGGTGFVAMNFSPVTSTVDGSENVVYSGATYAGATVAVPPAVGTNGLGSNSTHTSVGVGTLEWRLVSAGIRIKYSGTENNRGGAIVTHRSVQNDTTLGETYPTALSHDKSHAEPVDWNWHELLYIPVKPEDFEYKSVAESTIYPMCIIVASSANNTFDCEAVWHHELIGNLARGKIMSHSSTGDTETFISKVSQYAPSVLQSMKQYGQPLFDIGKTVMKAAYSDKRK